MIRSDGKVGGVGDLPLSHVNLQDPEVPLMHRDEMATEFANQVGPSGERLTETGEVTDGRHRGAELVVRTARRWMGLTEHDVKARERTEMIDGAW
ncbi:unnamed protein product, partial [Clonostachys chloroleuca]